MPSSSGPKRSRSFPEAWCPDLFDNRLRHSIPVAGHGEFKTVKENPPEPSENNSDRHRDLGSDPH